MRINGGPGCPARVPMRPLRVPATDPAARIFHALFLPCSASLYSAMTALTPSLVPSASAGTGPWLGSVVTATMNRSDLHASEAKPIVESVHECHHKHKAGKPPRKRLELVCACLINSACNLQCEEAAQPRKLRAVINKQETAAEWSSDACRAWSIPTGCMGALKVSYPEGHHTRGVTYTSLGEVAILWSCLAITAAAAAACRQVAA